MSICTAVVNPSAGAGKGRHKVRTKGVPYAVRQAKETREKRANMEGSPARTGKRGIGVKPLVS